jgi:hypothetical protein
MNQNRMREVKAKIRNGLDQARHDGRGPNSGDSWHRIFSNVWDIAAGVTHEEFQAALSEPTNFVNRGWAVRLNEAVRITQPASIFASLPAACQ